MLDSSQPSAHTELVDTPTQIEGSDIDYFEKFTLLDVAPPGEQVTDVQEEEVQKLGVKPQAEEQKPAEDKITVSPSASEESFVFVSDLDIVGDHLDEVFYGEGAPADALQKKNEEEANGGTRMRMRRESSVKESGSVLFGSEETTLTPIYFSSGPPKIIDPILLEEPTAMSFMYSDLYEDAVGQRVRSDEEFSEAESVASEKSYKRRLSDSDDADGYLEKFTLKDETPAEEVKLGSVDDKKERRMLWSQSRFEMTGCLTRMFREKEEQQEEKNKTEKLDTTKIGAVDTTRETPEKPIDLKDDRVDYHHIRDQTAPRSSNEPLSAIQEVDLWTTEKTEKDQTGEQRNICKDKQPCQIPEVAEKVFKKVLTKAADEISAETSVHMDVKTIGQTRNEDAVEKRPRETADEEVVASPEPTALVETSPESLISQQKEPAETFHVDDATVEIVTDCDFALQAVVEVIDKTVNAKEMQTQVQIDLQEVKNADVPDTEKAQMLKESLSVGTAPVEQPSAASHKSSRTKAVMLEKTETETDKKCQEIPEFSYLKTEKSAEPQITTEVKTTAPTVDSATAVPDTVDEGAEFILFVPRGQAVEMDIEVSQDLEQTTNNVEVASEPLPVDTTVHMEEIKTETLQPQSAAEVEEPVQNNLKKDFVQPASPALLQESNIEEEEDMMEDLGGDVDVLSPLRSFTPQADLSGLLCDMSEDTVVEPPVEINEVEDATGAMITEPDEVPAINLNREEVLSKDADIGQKMTNKEEAATEPTILTGNNLNRGDVLSEDTEAEKTVPIHKSEGETGQEIIQAGPGISLKRENVLSEIADVEIQVEKDKVEDSILAGITKQDEGLNTDLHKVDVGQKWQQDKVAVETPGEELITYEYEVISEQDAEEMPEPEPQRDTEDRGAMMDLDKEKNEFPPEDEPIEADYDIIDAEEETQARLAAELQGMDWYCVSCGCLLSEDDYGSPQHHSHQVTTVDKAYEEFKVQAHTAKPLFL